MELEQNDNINQDDISLDRLKKLFSEDLDTLFDETIKSSIFDSENLIQKNIDELINQYKDFKVDVKYINKSNNPEPSYAHKGDSGFDLRAFINTEEELITLLPNTWKAIPTGLYFEIPENYEMQVRPRSGLAFKNGVTVLNSPGTVDSGYRGEIQVILINHSQEPFIIKNGDRIAQGVICSVNSGLITKLTKTTELNETQRGDGKFGSTGIK